MISSFKFLNYRNCGRFAAWLLALLLSGFVQTGMAATVTGSAAITTGNGFTHGGGNLGGVFGCAMQPGNHYYTAIAVTPDTTGSYTLETTAATLNGTPANDPFLAIYGPAANVIGPSPFDPTAPGSNIVGCNDDANGLLSSFTTTLTAGQYYVMVVTTWAANISGTVDYQVSGLGNLVVVTPPTLSNVGNSNLTSSGATLAATSDFGAQGYWVVVPAGTTAPSNSQVKQGLDGNGNPATVTGSALMTANTPQNFTVTGLIASTAYTAYLMGENVAGLGGVQSTSFTTTAPAIPPTATTQAATGVTAVGATLNGTVDPQNADTTVTFEYGATVAYGSTAAAAQSPLLANSGSTAVSAAITGLNPNTLYHFRVVASNAGGTANGADQTFTTGLATATVNLGNLSQTYDGTAKSATCTTTPGGLTTSIAYDGSTTAPTNAGNYVVVCTVTDPSYSGSANGTLTIAKADQTITFNPPASGTVGGNATLSATAGSGLAVTFGSQTASVCTVSGSTVNYAAAGTCTVRASQAGNANYNPAPDVDRNITVGGAPTDIPTLSEWAMLLLIGLLGLFGIRRLQRT